LNNRKGIWPIKKTLLQRYQKKSLISGKNRPFDQKLTLVVMVVVAVAVAATARIIKQ